MAINNGFPVTYQPMYYQQPIQQPMMVQAPTQQSSSQNNITWVQGEAGAKSYLVAPNTTVQLWDSEKQTIYLKSADNSGMPTMKILDYTIRDDKPTQNVAITSPDTLKTDFVTRDDISSIEEQIQALEKRIESLSSKKTYNNAKGRVIKDE